MTIYRYPLNQVITSTQSGFSDVMDWLGFLCAKDYLLDVLVRVHNLTVDQAESRAQQIIPHVRIAMGFIRQSLEGPGDISFLPAYYAILNLSKVYVLLGPRHADLMLPEHRMHGASYQVAQNNTSVLAESVRLWPKGAFPLFYETLTGRAPPPDPFDLTVETFLSRIATISYEYSLAGGKSQMCSLRPGAINTPAGLCALVVADEWELNETTRPLQLTDKSQVPCLEDFSFVRGVPDQFIGKPLPPGPRTPAALEVGVRLQLKAHLILRVRKYTVTALGPTPIEFPEEVPIWLLFFYMSSIVRYKPEFLSRLKDSRYWPPISCARLHSFLEFTLTLWSFVHKQNYFLEAP